MDELNNQHLEQDRPSLLQSQVWESRARTEGGRSIFRCESSQRSSSFREEGTAESPRREKREVARWGSFLLPGSGTLSSPLPEILVDFTDQSLLSTLWNLPES